ncbi:hypothetical protein [Algoriphagus sp. CAU 1675]|uniref:hypothetical protein n=1 Tax=Algoriphagus sp. CAU 1675 TaxID=3032597 RepID=UPI0023DC5A9A|nr:hypothetical protein [Algoriphagus sp. CAU 1675]MDF2158658.1 hypothetical protein [Algoriphagus sp. CAU 1675]
MKKSNLKMGVLCLGFFGMFFLNTPKAEAQTMTCTLVPGSIIYYPDGMVCASYSCPNGETVQACNLPEVGVE